MGKKDEEKSRQKRERQLNTEVHTGLMNEGEREKMRGGESGKQNETGVIYDGVWEKGRGWRRKYRINHFNQYKTHFVQMHTTTPSPTPLETRNRFHPSSLYPQTPASSFLFSIFVFSSEVTLPLCISFQSLLLPTDFLYLIF